jgi:hypothetical protein
MTDCLIFIDRLRPAEAIKSWVTRMDTGALPHLGNAAHHQLLHDLERQNSVPVPLRDVENTWCATTTLNGHLALIHLVATVDSTRGRDDDDACRD